VLVTAPRQEAISIRLDDDVLDRFKKEAPATRADQCRAALVHAAEAQETGLNRRVSADQHWAGLPPR
jgi:predicted transcriptional regulator